MGETRIPVSGTGEEEREGAVEGRRRLGGRRGGEGSGAVAGSASVAGLRVEMGLVDETDSRRFPSHLHSLPSHRKHRRGAN